MQQKLIRQSIEINGKDLIFNDRVFMLCSNTASQLKVIDRFYCNIGKITHKDHTYC